MARKRTELGADAESRIVSLMRAGGTVDSIVSQLGAEGVTASRATIARRMRELSGRVKEARAKIRSAPPVPGVTEPAKALSAIPEDIPEDASLAQLDAWIAIADEGINKARDEGDLPIMGQLLSRGAQLKTLRLKASPPTAPDPNANPDYIKLAKEVAARLHKMVDAVTELEDV